MGKSKGSVANGKRGNDKRNVTFFSRFFGGFVIFKTTFFKNVSNDFGH